MTKSEPIIGVLWMVRTVYLRFYQDLTPPQSCFTFKHSNSLWNKRWGSVFIVMRKFNDLNVLLPFLPQPCRSISIAN